MMLSVNVSAERLGSSARSHITAIAGLVHLDIGCQTHVGLTVLLGQNRPPSQLVTSSNLIPSVGSGCHISLIPSAAVEAEAFVHIMGRLALHLRLVGIFGNTQWLTVAEPFVGLTIYHSVTICKGYRCVVNADSLEELGASLLVTIESKSQSTALHIVLGHLNDTARNECSACRNIVEVGP